MAVKIFQALSLLVTLSVATSCILLAEGAGTDRPEESGFFKIFNSEGYLTATENGVATRTPKDGVLNPNFTTWFTECDPKAAGVNCQIAALLPPPNWQFYGRLDPYTGPVFETDPLTGDVRLNYDLEDPVPLHWNIHPALPGGGWHITSNATRGLIGYLTFWGDQVLCVYLETVAPGETPRKDQIPGEDMLWYFEETGAASA